MMLVCGVYGLLCNHLLSKLKTIHLYVLHVEMPQVCCCFAKVFKEFDIVLLEQLLPNMFCVSRAS